MPWTRLSHALRAISPPIPAGSPIVTASGSTANSNPDVDKGGAPQIAHVAAGQGFGALARPPVGNLVARRQGRVRRRLVAYHDHPDPILLNNRLRGLSNLQHGHDSTHGRSDLVGPQVPFAR